MRTCTAFCVQIARISWLLSQPQEKGQSARIQTQVDACLSTFEKVSIPFENPFWFECAARLFCLTWMKSAKAHWSKGMCACYMTPSSSCQSLFFWRAFSSAYTPSRSALPLFYLHLSRDNSIIFICFISHFTVCLDNSTFHLFCLDDRRLVDWSVLNAASLTDGIASSG